MLISIIIPVYDDSQNLNDLFKSVDSLLETHEFIVVDGCEERPSLGSAKDDIIYICERDFGIYDAMNKGVAAASGDYVFFCGVDDRIEVDSFHKFAKELYNEDLILGKIVYPSGNTRSSKFDRRLYLSNTVHHQGCLYRRKLFDSYKFNSALRIGADYEMNLHLFQFGCSFRELDIVFAKVGMEGISNSSGNLGYYEEMESRRNVLGSGLLTIFLNTFTLIIKVLFKISRKK